MSSGTRSDGESLSQCYEPQQPTETRWLRPIEDTLRTVLGRRLLARVVGDGMRCAYGWRRPLLVGVMTTCAVTLGIRAVLTGAFVALVTTDLLLVGLFNVVVTGLLGGWLFASDTALASVGRRSLVRRVRGIVSYSEYPSEKNRL